MKLFSVFIAFPVKLSTVKTLTMRKLFAVNKKPKQDKHLALYCY